MTTLSILFCWAVISVDHTFSFVDLFACLLPSVLAQLLLQCPEQQARCVVWRSHVAEACCVRLDREWVLPVAAGCASAQRPCPQAPGWSHRGAGCVLGASFCGGARCLSALRESSASGFLRGSGRISGALVVSLVCFLRPALASPLHFSFWSWLRV